MSSIKINLDSLNPKSFKKTVRHKVQDGNNIFRILPPFGSESEGYPYRKWNVVWGLSDPTSGRPRPFASSSTYEGRCPVYDYLELLKAKVSTLADESRVEVLNKFISDLRPKTVYAYNAADKSGQVGILELKATAHKKILSLMDKYIKDYNQDPTSLNSESNDSGIWFNITKAGKGFDTTYDATKNQVKAKDESGVLIYKDDRSPLAESIVHNFNSLGYDLNGLYQKLTYDELKEVLVANLLNLAKDMPELLVPGFGDGDDHPVSDEGHIIITATTSQNRPASANSAKPQGNGANIKLGKVEDVGDDTDDILAMADDLFNS